MRGILSVWTISSSLPEEASRLKKNFLVGTYETVPFVCHVKLTFSHCSLYTHTQKKENNRRVNSILYKAVLLLLLLSTPSHCTGTH